MIELTGVTKLYNTVIGVNDVTVSLPPGAHGLLGPNGAGKTTFLNLITGQLCPTLGRVTVFDRNPRNQAQVLRRIGVCPGEEAFYSNVSGMAWVKFLLELRGFQSSEATERAQQSLDLLGMKDAMDRAIGTYSRGMRQRTKLAQAIAHDPDLLILDEPFSGLDPVGRSQVTEFLRNWAADGRSLLLASHILHEVEAVSSSFLLICGGRLLASGTADEIHSVLADLPTELHLQCGDPEELARRLIDAGLVTTVTIGKDQLVVATSTPLKVYETLPKWSGDRKIRLREVHSESGSVQAMFDSLMKVHRGVK